jgi:hypothetical protein
MQNLLRYMNPLRAGACALAVLFAPAALGQDNQDIRDSAYCVGVLRHSKDVLARLGAPSEQQNQTERLASRSAIIRAAVGKHDIDAASTRQLIALGRADAEICWDRVDACFDSGAADLQSCMQPVEATCLKTKMCNR